MITNSSEVGGSIPQPSEPIGTIPSPSEQFRPVPNTSESFGTIQNDSEQFRPQPHRSELFRNARTEAHIITVREAARMFETAGVARTERSIVKWCREDATGIARLDAHLDPNERRYYITEESIQRAISEEKAKVFRNVPNGAESIPKRSEPDTVKQNQGNAEHATPDDVESLRKELFNLQILNAGKDIAIKQLGEQRDKWIQQLMDGSKKIGELETRLLQLEEPSERKISMRQSLPKGSEEFGI